MKGFPTIGKANKRSKTKKLSNSPLKRIKVQLNHNTTVMINRRESFKIWKEKYPEAKVVK